MRDIVSTFRNVSTGSDQAHTAMRAAGGVMPSLVAGNHVASGGFTRTAVKRGDSAFPDLAKDFSVRDKVIGVVLTWLPDDRLRGQATLRVFDSENKVVAQGAPLKVNFRKGSQNRTVWALPTFQVPGVYRVDVLIDARTYWRGFFRLNP